MIASYMNVNDETQNPVKSLFVFIRHRIIIELDWHCTYTHTHTIFFALSEKRRKILMWISVHRKINCLKILMMQSQTIDFPSQQQATSVIECWLNIDREKCKSFSAFCLNNDCCRAVFNCAIPDAASKNNHRLIFSHFLSSLFVIVTTTQHKLTFDRYQIFRNNFFCCCCYISSFLSALNSCLPDNNNRKKKLFLKHVSST